VGVSRRAAAGALAASGTALIVAGVLLMVVTTVAPGVMAVAGHHVRIDTSGNLYPVSPAWTIAGNVAAVAAITSMLAWLAVQVPRYRRSSDERREQLKWLYSGATASTIAVLRTPNGGDLRIISIPSARLLHHSCICWSGGALVTAVICGNFSPAPVSGQHG
jgi:hypothetical protein